MEDARFDKLTRSLGDRLASRRAMFPLAGALLAFAADAASLDAQKRKNNKNTCKKNQRCGSKCCKDCFYKSNMSDVGPMGKDCCPKSKVCKKDGFLQQCCYADEQCRPDNVEDNNGNGLCCRSCFDGVETFCCKDTEFCNNGFCDNLNGPARQARRRI